MSGVVYPSGVIIRLGPGPFDGSQSRITFACRSERKAMLMKRYTKAPAVS